MGDKRVKYEDKTRHLALSMYLNGMGFRSIGRVLEVPFQLVHQWIKTAGQRVEAQVETIANPSRNIEILEMDELYTFIQKKRGKFAFGLLLIGTEMKLLRIT